MTKNSVSRMDHGWCMRSAFVLLRSLFALWLLAGAGCDKLSLPDQTATDPAAAPGTPPPSTSSPEIAQRSPEQIIENFQALQPALRNDELLKELSELPLAQEEMNELNLAGGAITDRGLDVLPAFAAVTALDLSHTRISGEAFQSVVQMPALEKLSLEGVAVGEDPYAALAAAPGLKSLSLAGTGVGDGVFAHLAELEGLESLDVSGNPRLLGAEFTALVKMNHFAELTQLAAAETQFGFYGLQELGRLENLQTLKLSNSAVGNESLQGIRRCTSLRVLYLSDNNISDQGLVALTSLKALEELRLGGCAAITDQGLKPIRALKQLELLNLDGTLCTVAGAQNLKDRFLTDTTITIAGQEL